MSNEGREKEVTSAQGRDAHAPEGRRSAREANTPTGANADRRFGVVRMLLGFLDRNLKHFAPWVQNAIGVVVLLVLAIYILNGFVAPTFVRGQLFLKESPTAGKTQVSGYLLQYHNEVMTTNLWGNWMLPVYRSGIPTRIKIQILGPGGTYVDQFSFWGPWPVWSAIVPMEYDLEVHSFEPQGKRVKVVAQRLGDSSLAAFLRWTEWVSPAYAQSPRPALAPPPPKGPALPLPAPTLPSTREPARPAGKAAETAVGSTPWTAVVLPGDPKFIPAYGVAIQSTNITGFPSWFRSGGKVYFTVTLDGRPVEDANLISDPELPRGQARLFWVPAAPETAGVSDTPYPLRFPVKSIKESWLPIRAGHTERFAGLIGNLIGAVTFEPEPSRAKAASFRVQPKGQLELKMWADNDMLLGAFDITKVVQTYDRPVTLKSTVAGQEATIEILFMPGWVVGIPTPSPVKQQK